MRIEGIIASCKQKIELACKEATETNRPWPNRVSEPIVPHLELSRIYTSVLDELNIILPIEANEKRDFMVACLRLVYTLEVCIVEILVVRGQVVLLWTLSFGSLSHSSSFKSMCLYIYIYGSVIYVWQYVNYFCLKTCVCSTLF